MQYLIFLLFSLFCFFTSLPVKAANSYNITKKAYKLAGYRVIRASPIDFRSALWMKETPTEDYGKNRSRLSHFLKIKNKSIHKDFVSFQVIPDVSLFKENGHLTQLTEFIISSQPTTSQNYRLEITVNTALKNSVHGHIDVTPHELGSLLTFYIEKSTYSDFTIDLLIKSFQLIRVTSTDPESAATQTRKELK